MDKNPNDFPKDVNKKQQNQKTTNPPDRLFCGNRHIPAPKYIRQQPANPYPKNA